VSRSLTGRPSADVVRRRRMLSLAALAALAVVATALAVLLFGGEEAADAPGQPVRASGPPPAELPRGGRSILPEFRVVAFYGAPQSDELGELGIGSPDSAGRRLARQAKAYERKRRPVLPAMELIAVIAAAHPGEDGMYRTRQDNRTIRRYLRAARRHKALLLLDIQPGRSDFFTETTRLERWLREPDVGLALDPEWRVTDAEVPGQVIGQVGSREVNATTAWLDQLVAEHELPEKLVVIHQFTDDMVDDTQLKPRDGLEIILNADGFGGQAVKKAKYHAFTKQAPGFDPGFKLFYREDVDLMTPRQVMRLRPPPAFVVYE
jgi:hypothetical protein